MGTTTEEGQVVDSVDPHFLHQKKISMYNDHSKEGMLDYKEEFLCNDMV